MHVMLWIMIKIKKTIFFININSFAIPWTEAE